MKKMIRYRQRAGKSTTKSTAASERERQIHEPARSKKKGFGKARKT
jgi:hypothetical protein